MRNVTTLFLIFGICVQALVLPASVLAQTITPTDTPSVTDTPTPTPTIDIFSNLYLTPSPTFTLVDTASSSALSYGMYSMSHVMWTIGLIVVKGLGVLIGLSILYY